MSSYILRSALDQNDILNIKYSKELKDLLEYITYIIDTLSSKNSPEDVDMFHSLVMEVNKLWLYLNL